MLQTQPMPSTISFDRQFENLPLVTVVSETTKFTTLARGNRTFPGPAFHGRDTYTTAPLSGVYEVTATRDGNWHISDVWLTLDNGQTGFAGRTMAYQVRPGPALWGVLVDLITTHDRAAIEARIAEEISQ